MGRCKACNNSLYKDESGPLCPKCLNISQENPQIDYLIHLIVDLREEIEMLKECNIVK